MHSSALILGRNNGVGLDRDAALVSEALARGGYSCDAPPPRNLLQLLRGGRRNEIAIHLERAWPLWHRKANTHFLIPNQERYPLRQLRRLRSIDHILCKSQHAVQIFAEHHPSVHLIRFTSHDRNEAEVATDYSRFLHVGGRSSLKNSALIIDVWRRHPEWPELTLIFHGDHALPQLPENVTLLNSYLDDARLRRLQNECGIHLCPSLAEGWGHYIAEAMSCEAVVLTTDGPPMNELVTSSRGYLVPVHHIEPRHLGTKYHVDAAALENGIAELLAMSERDKVRLGQAARAWFVANESAFQTRFVNCVRELAGSGGTQQNIPLP